MNSTLKKTYLSFHEGVLSLKFRENTLIEVEDVIYIHCFALEKSKGKPYGILFDTSSKHELSEEAIVHITQSGYLKEVIGLAYISRDIISKIRLNLLLIFEKPAVKIKSFNNPEDAHKWISGLVRLEQPVFST